MGECGTHFRLFFAPLARQSRSLKQPLDLRDELPCFLDLRIDTFFIERLVNNIISIEAILEEIVIERAVIP